MHAFRGEVGLGEKAAREGMAIAKEVGSPGVLISCENAMVENYLRVGRDDEARAWLRSETATMKRIGVRLTPTVFPNAILKLRKGDRSTGLAWLGFSRLNDPEKEGVNLNLKIYADLIRGDATEEEVEAAMKAGESLTLEEIVAQIEAEG